jgi:hypothetical protein
MQGIEAFVEREIGRTLVFPVGGLPETAAIASYVPVAELVDK